MSCPRPTYSQLGRHSLLTMDVSNRSAYCYYRLLADDQLEDLCGRPLHNASSREAFVVEGWTRFVYLITYPLLLFLGTAGNAFCLKLFLQNRKKTLQTVLLMVLCLANMVVMFLDLPEYFGCYCNGIRDDSSIVEALRRTAGTLMWTQHTFILISNWILILHGISKLLTITRPRLTMEPFHGYVSGFVLTIICLLFSIPHIIFYHEWRSDTEAVCPMSVCHYLNKFSRIYRSLDISSFEIGIPIITYGLVLIVSVAVFVVIWKHPKSRPVISNGTVDTEKPVETKEVGTMAESMALTTLHEADEEKASSSHSVPPAIPLKARWWGLSSPGRMLSRCILLYLITHLPDMIFILLLTLSSYPSCALTIPEATFMDYYPVIHIIALVNYSLNFLLYVGLLEKWRPKRRVLTPTANVRGTVRPVQFELAPLVRAVDTLAVPPGSASGSRKVSSESGLRKISRRLSFWTRPKKSDVAEPEKPIVSALVKAVGSILSDQEFQDLWRFLPFRFRIYAPELIFSTSEDGISLFNFFVSARGHKSTIIAVKTLKGEIFGAFCADSWDERVHGKKEYLFFGTGETFLFSFDPVLRLYPWVGLCGRKTTPDSCLFMAADSNSLIIGGGGGQGICFSNSLARGFSSPCATFDNPAFCENGEFESAVVEVYGFEEMILDSDDPLPSTKV
ncbi:uncharacterized protein LOC129592089 isoform X2 [Paramacrobiotus metropolitanus]|uniref:uncharacterized protein LOC129592089 isoform X2 n=1 Tax=Paramacrobiotus metropolitanus TaxID=2943436 RepID=UPI0024457D4F|nr:uncharacterized protein LOC129592089 isoform X2 [Paramacrobiotus metropolitanus]